MSWEILSRLSDVVGLLSTGVAIIQWMIANAKSPLSIAFDQTVACYKDDLPAVKDQLAAFLASNAVKDVLFKRVTQEAPDLDWLAEEFVTRGSYFGDENVKKVGVDNTGRLAPHVVTTFVQKLIYGLMTSNESVVYHDAREGERHRETRQVTLDKVSQAEEHMTAKLEIQADRVISTVTDVINHALKPDVSQVLEPIWKTRVEQIKELMKGNNPQVALDLWQQLLTEVERKAPSNRELLVEIHTNIASSYWTLGEKNEAGEAFTRAFECFPQNKRARLNLALAYMIRDESQKAHTVIDGVLLEYQNDERALAVKANLFVLEDRYQEIVTLFEGYWDAEKQKLSLSDSNCCRFLGVALIELHRWDEAVSVLEQGLELDQQDPGLQALLATALSNRSGQAAPDLRLDSGERQDLQRADALFTSALGTFEKLGLVEAVAQTLHNRAGIRFQLDKQDEAYEDARLAWQKQPENATMLQRYALFSLNSGNVSVTIPLLEKQLKESLDAEVAALLFESYVVQHRIGAASKIQSFVDTILEGKLDLVPASSLEVFGESLVRAHNYPQVQQVVDLLLSHEEGCKAHLLLSYLEEEKGNREGAFSECQKAYDLADQKNDEQSLYSVAQHYYRLGKWDEARLIFERLGVTDLSPRGLVKDYLACLVNSGVEDHENTILSIAQGYRQTRGLDPLVAQAELAVLETRGHFKAANELWSLILKEAPNPHFVVGAARCLYRNGDYGPAKDLLLSISVMSLASYDLLLAAQLLDRLGEPLLALEFAYYAWRNEPASQETNLGYISVFFSVTQRHKLNLEADVVAPGTAVTLTFEDSAEKTWLLVDEGRKLLADEVSSSSDVALRLLGHKPNDVILWPSAFGSTKQATVTQVRNKYVWAFQTASTNHTMQFPMDQSLQAITVKEGDISDLLVVLDKQYESATDAIKQYKESSIPFWMLAKLLGRNIFETWSGVLESAELPLVFSFNTMEERLREVGPDTQAAAVVCDSLALFTLNHLGLLGKLADSGLRLVTSRQTLDNLVACKEYLLDFAESGHATIGKTEAGYFRLEVPRERVLADIEFIDHVLEFSQKHLEVLPRPRQYTEFERKLILAVGEEAVVPIVLASNITGACYYSDDARLRAFVFGEHKTPGLNTMGVSSLLKSKSLLTEKERALLVVRLIRSHYESVPVSVQDLLALALDRFDPYCADFTTLLDQLFSRGTDIRSSLSVTARFLQNLLLKVHLFSTARPFIAALMERVLKHSGLKGIRAVYTALSDHGPIEVPNVTNGAAYVQTWLKEKLSGRMPQ